jgi:para-aminobenzoate synthetase component I
VRQIELSADEIVSGLLRLSEREPVFLLDSCGVGHLGSHLLIASFRPIEMIEVSDEDPERTLRMLDRRPSDDLAAFFTLSYEFGAKLQYISESFRETAEPDLFLALVDFLIIHDYDSDRTYLVGNDSRFDELADLFPAGQGSHSRPDHTTARQTTVTSDFTKSDYIQAVERVREHIRAGDTYQTNLTQQLRVELPEGAAPEIIFRRLRRDHPAPFAAFIRRTSSTVVSASPERFFRVSRDRAMDASPIKGTRRRGATPAEDVSLRNELASSEKDRAENTMIVDLVRNDFGRVCDFGTVVVEKLCEIEEHPTLFHLVSTVRGRLRVDADLSDILRAVFPCGSITGAPKIRTMQIIRDLEPSPRGLSMGAIGIRLPTRWGLEKIGIETEVDVSVAIRTMVVREGVATFNVGGGVVIDSDPEKEFDESLLKAKALLAAIGAAR